MAEITVSCCGHELRQDPDVNEKWVCDRCGRVFAVVGRRSIRSILGGEDRGRA